MEVQSTWNSVHSRKVLSVVFTLIVIKMVRNVFHPWRPQYFLELFVTTCLAAETVSQVTADTEAHVLTREIFDWICIHCDLASLGKHDWWHLNLRAMAWCTYFSVCLSLSFLMEDISIVLKVWATGLQGPSDLFGDPEVKTNFVRILTCHLPCSWSFCCGHILVCQRLHIVCYCSILNVEGDRKIQT